jgi:hypothetical protein
MHNPASALSSARSLRTPPGMGAARASRPQPSAGGYCDDARDLNFVACDVIHSEIHSIAGLNFWICFSISCIPLFTDRLFIISICYTTCYLSQWPPDGCGQEEALCIEQPLSHAEFTETSHWRMPPHQSTYDYPFQCDVERIQQKGRNGQRLITQTILIIPASCPGSNWTKTHLLIVVKRLTVTRNSSHQLFAINHPTPTHVASKFARRTALLPQPTAIPSLPQYQSPLHGLRPRSSRDLKKQYLQSRTSEGLV